MTSKTRNMMYVQQISRMKLDLNELGQIIELECNKFAYIVHDKDVDENNKLIAPHIHLLMNFINPRSIKNIAKLLKDKPNQIENMSKYGKNGFNNSLSYLIHKTDDAKNKFQYSIKNVVANFDYAEEIKRISNEVAIYKSRKISENAVLVQSIFNESGAGLINIDEARQKLLDISGKTLAENSQKLERLYKDLRNIKYKQWLNEKRKNPVPIEVIWVYGDSGTGKTRFARELAKNKGLDFYISGATNDPFQGYSGENLVILDELRPNTFKYEDLLRMLDPWSFDSMTSARYKNQHLMADTFVITSPFDPLYFYNLLGKDESDSGKQLLRRISLLINMDYNHISPVKINTRNNTAYLEIQSDKSKENSYITTMGDVTTVSFEKLFLTNHDNKK